MLTCREQKTIDALVAWIMSGMTISIDDEDTQKMVKELFGSKGVLRNVKQKRDG